jgi:hypothetical protein
MAREMAKSLCQQFQNCRLMENAVDPQNRTFRDKGIWHLTPKGLCVLQDFCVRTEVNMTTLRKHFSHMEAIHLVRLDRNPDDDQLVLNRACVSVIFKVMMTCLPLDGELTSSGNASSMSVSSRQQQQSTTSTPPSSSTSSVSSATSSSTPSLSAPFAMSSTVSGSDSRVHMLGNYLLTLSKSGRTTTQPKTAKTMRTLFSSQMCCDWLLDYNTVSCREEAEAIAQEFIKYNWIEFQDPKHHSLPLKSSKVSMFVVTDKGKQVVSEPVKQPNSPSVSHQLSDRSKITTTSNIVRSRSNTITKEDNEPTEEEKTTLREILSQDPDSLLITQQSTTTTDDIEDAITNTTSSRPPSIAVENNSNHTPVDSKESNSARLKIILESAKLRSPFKDFLRANFCEENLDFWIDYNTLRRKCRNQSPALPSQNQKDLLEDAYDIWSTYLAPGSSCELNVEHSLCQEMARIVHSVVTVIPAYPGQGKPTIVITASSASQSLRMMLKLFDRVNEHICRLMASDSVPKFVKTEKYRKIIDSIERNERKKQKELEELTDSLRKMDSTDDLYQTNTETTQA